jgi:hypothetical protein
MRQRYENAGLSSLRTVNLVAAPGRDQPRARIEDHAALVALVRREHLAQALDGTGRVAVAEAYEGGACVLKSPDEGERGI